MMDKLPPGHYVNMKDAILALEAAHVAQRAAISATVEESAKQKRQRYHKMQQDNALKTSVSSHGPSV